MKILIIFLLLFTLSCSTNKVSQNHGFRSLETIYKKIAINNNDIEETFEKKKHEIANNIITKKANLEILISSIFFPIQINKKLLNNVADA